MASVTYSWNQDFDFLNVVINTTTAGDQANPAVAAFSGGGWLAAWVDPANDSDVRARIMEDDGTPRTATDFAVLSLANSTDGAQTDPSLATLIEEADGGVNAGVAVAMTHTPVGEDSRAQVTSIDPDGSGGRHGMSVGIGQEGDIAALPDDEVVLSYTSDLGADGFDVRALPSEPFGSVEVSSTSTTIDSRASAVAGLGGGGFVVAYQETDELFFRRFDSNADALDALPVLIDTDGSVNRDIQIESLRDGGFVVAYTDNEFTPADPANEDIHVKIYNQNGSLRANLGRINNFTVGIQDEPALTLLSNGFFVVGWQNQGGLKAQAFDPDGNEIGVEHDLGGMIDADVAGVTDGRLISVRSSISSDIFPGSSHSIRASASDLVRTTTADDTGETLTGDELIDIMNGGTGNDTLSGEGADDILDGAGGNDILDGGTGADTMTGGPGDDVFVVDEAGDVVIEAADGGIDEIRTAISIFGLQDHVNIENLTYIGSGDFFGGGNDSANVIRGGAGEDAFNGRGGNDTLHGGAGDDTAVYASARSDYQVHTVKIGGVPVTSVRDGVGTEGNDTLREIETLQFAGVPVTLFGVQQNRTSNVDGARFDDVVYRSVSNGQVIFQDMEAGAPTGFDAVTNPLTNEWRAIGTGDVTGDAKADVFVWNSTTGQVFTASPGASGSPTWGILANGIAGEFAALGETDISGDGLTDLLVHHSPSGTIYWQDSANPASWGFVGVNLGSEWSWKASGDVNRDGFSDVAIAHTSGQVLVANMANGVNSGYIDLGDISGFAVRAIADVNGDGFADVVVQSEANGQTLWRDLSGQGDPWKVGSDPLGTDWIAAGAGDFDNDGDAETVFQHAVTGETIYKDLTAATASGWGVVSTPLNGEWVVV